MMSNNRSRLMFLLAFVLLIGAVNVPFAARASAAAPIAADIHEVPTEGEFRISSSGLFDFPIYTAVDADGNVYVVDRGNNRVQKFADNGAFIREWGGYGSGDGEFDSPEGIAVSASSGNVYVVDVSNHRVQMFDSDGQFLGKWGSQGTGIGQFNYPSGVALDAEDNVYVTDTFNHRVQKFNSNGAFITRWGEVGGDLHKFEQPSGIGTDADGNVYVADSMNNQVKKFNPDGEYISHLGNRNGDLFRQPEGIAIDANGNLYVSDTSNHRVQIFKSNGNYLGQWGSDGSGNGQFRYPFGLAVADREDGTRVYVADAHNNRMQVFEVNDAGSEWTADYVYQWGSYGKTTMNARKSAVDADGNIYITDNEAAKVRKFDASGVLLSEWGGHGSELGQFHYPNGIAIDSSGNVYVADSGNHRIQKMGPDGSGITAWGSEGDGNGEFVSPGDIAIDSNGYLYVVDRGNLRIQKFDWNGGYVAQLPIVNCSMMGEDNPVHLATDADGNLYVLYTYGGFVQKLNGDGTLLEQWGENYCGVGEEEEEEEENEQYGKYIGATDIEVDADGNVYLTGNYWDPIIVLDSDGAEVATWTGGLGDAALAYPFDLELRSDGLLYVMEYMDFDAYDSRVRLFSLDNNTLVNGLTLSEGDLHPSFSAGNSGPYSVYVDPDTDELTVTTQAVDPMATVSVGVSSGTVEAEASENGTSFTIPLIRGKNTISITVTAMDGTTSVSYAIEAYRLNPNALLSGMEVDQGELTPTFIPETFNYSVDVAHEVESLEFSLTKDDSTQEIAVTGAEYESETDGVYTYRADLEVGHNPIGITVTAQDNTSNAYELIVDRAAAVYSVTFDSNGGTPVSEQAVEENDYAVEPSPPSRTGYAFVGWYSDAGLTNAFDFAATAITGDLTLVAKWAPVLGSLEVDQGTLTPTFGPEIFDYTVNVAHVVEQLEFSLTKGDPTQEITVAGATYQSVTDSVYTYRADLEVGSNPIVMEITAEDETISTYTVNVTRAPRELSGNADLSDLSLSGGATLHPVFAAGTLTYTANVTNSVASITVTPGTSDGHATVTVNGLPVGSGQASAPIGLNVGSNTVTVVVTAQNGTTKTYSVTVTRATAPVNPDPGGTGGGDVTAPVTSTDGRLTLPAGRSGQVSLATEVVVTIPAQASDRELTLSIDKLTNTLGLLDKQELLLSPVFELLKNRSDNFRVPVTLTFAFDAAGMRGDQRAAIFYFDETNKVWVEVPGSKANVDRISAEVDHFTKFAVLAVDRDAASPATVPATSASNVSLSDIAGHWAQAGIEQAVILGIVRGYADSTFRPDATVTRAEFAVMLMGALKPEAADGETPPAFADDAQIGAWAKQAVAQAVRSGIVKGYADNTFRPNADITRAEMAAMIANALGAKPASTPESAGFADDRDIPAWARGAVAALRERGLVQGKANNAFAPNDGATRAEAVTVLLKMLAWRAEQ